MTRKYFIYHNSEEFEADVISAGAPIELSSEYSYLLEPVQIGGLTTGNSCAIHPMEGCDGELDGRPGELTIRRYRRFAQGGCSILWGEATAVQEEARMNTRQLWINESNWEDFARLADETRGVHHKEWGASGGLLLGLQLTHSGRYAYGRPLIPQRDPGLDPTTFIDPITKTNPIGADYPVLTDEYLERLEEDFVRAAELIARAGFDFVDIKQCHRYLLNELLSSRSRDGAYGGSYENRTRFIKNVVARIRERVPGLVIATRMNVFDGVPYMKDPGTGAGTPRPHEIPFLYGWGTNVSEPSQPDLSEPLRLAGELRDLGLAMLSVSMGNPYTSPHYVRPFDTPPPDGYETPEHPAVGVKRHFDLTGEIQQHYPDLPVLGAGYSWLQWLMCDAAAANLKSGRCRVAGFGRGAMAYPDFMRDLLEGGMVKTKVCITVSYCTSLMRYKHNSDRQFPTGCVVRDRYYADLYKNATREYRELITRKDARRP